MALPTYQDLKSYLRLSASTAEDTLLTALVARAQRIVEGLLQAPILAEERQFDLAPRDHDVYGAASVLALPVWPVDPDTVVVTDPDGATVSAALLEADARSGTIRHIDNELSAAWYRVTAEVGWSAHPAYATKYEPILSAAILDVAADLAQRRDPGANSESAGGGDATSYEDRASEPVLARVRVDLRAMVGPRVA